MSHMALGVVHLAHDALPSSESFRDVRSSNILSLMNHTNSNFVLTWPAVLAQHLASLVGADIISDIISDKQCSHSSLPDSLSESSLSTRKILSRM